MWKECIALSRSNRLALSCKKDSSNKLNSKGIGNALCVAYPFFIILQRSLWEYQGHSSECPQRNAHYYCIPLCARILRQGHHFIWPQRLGDR